MVFNINIKYILFTVFIAIILGCMQNKEKQDEFWERKFEIFQNNMIHFSPDNKDQYETVRVSSGDNGREIWTQMEIPDFHCPVKITAQVNLYPIPKDVLSVYDPWDRAGHVRLVGKDSIDVEILKFVTAYGGKTSWEVDVSYLAPLLKGNCIFVGFIDTWVSPGWRIDCNLIFEPGIEPNPDWIQPVFYVLEYKTEKPGDDGVETYINVPNGLQRVNMHYLVSGHCTDGRGPDEFEPKDNIFYIDDEEIHRFRPWREDCLQFRAINPYTRRWSNGDWSSDFSRSGWCPGDVVKPIDIDMTSLLKPGEHTLKLIIKNVRPKNSEEHFGYWRVSGVLTGWK